MGVHHQAPASRLRALPEPQAESQSGVLSGQEGAQVLVEREDQLHLTCGARKEGFFLFFFFTNNLPSFFYSLFWLCATDRCCCIVAKPALISAGCCHCRRSEGTSGPACPPQCSARTPPDLRAHRDTGETQQRSELYTRTQTHTHPRAQGHTNIWSPVAETSFVEIVGQQKGSLFHRVQQQGRRARLVDAVHIGPGHQGLRPQQVINSLNHRLRGDQTGALSPGPSWLRARRPLAVQPPYLDISFTRAFPLLQLKGEKSIARRSQVSFQRSTSKSPLDHVRVVPCCNCVLLTLYWLVSRPAAGNPGHPEAAQPA